MIAKSGHVHCAICMQILRDSISNRVVDCTAKAYGIGIATVKKICQEFADFSGTLKCCDKNQDR